MSMHIQPVFHGFRNEQTAFTIPTGMNPVCLIASGTAWAHQIPNPPGTKIGVIVKIKDSNSDVKAFAELTGYTNVVDSHLALPFAFTSVTGLNAGNYTIAFDLNPDYPNTTLDDNDFFSIAIAEMETETL